MLTVLGHRLFRKKKSQFFYFVFCLDVVFSDEAVKYSNDMLDCYMKVPGDCLELFCIIIYVIPAVSIKGDL